VVSYLGLEDLKQSKIQRKEEGKKRLKKERERRKSCWLCQSLLEWSQSFAPPKLNREQRSYQIFDP